MLTKQNRFQGRASLGLVFRRGTVTRGRSLGVRWLPDNKANLRAAIVVSRKISKSAVVRNRIRRRIYNLLEANLTNLKNGDLIITVFDASLAEAPAADVEQALKEILKRAQILS
jgi:ribonuclease P protein component